MANKIILFILVLTLSYLIFQEQKSFNEPHSTEILTSKTKPNLDLDSTSKPSIKKNIDTQTRDTNDLLLASQEYSSIPFINLTIVKNLFIDCARMFDDQRTSELNDYLDDVSDIDKEKKQIRFEECQEINSAHPEYQLSNKSNFNNLTKNIKVESILSKFINHDLYIGEDSEKDQLFIEELKQTDPQIFFPFNVLNNLLDYHMVYSREPLMEIVQTQQIGYINDLIYVAQFYYNCEINNGCSGYDEIVKFMCKDELYCDSVDFRDYINRSARPGYLADIKLVVAYYQSLLSN